MQRNIKNYGKAGHYIEYLPSVEPQGIINFYHGSGEVAAKGGIDIIERNELLKLLKNGLEIPYIVIAAQLIGNSWGRATQRSMFQILDTYGNYEKHQTGISLGGMGTVAAATYAFEWNDYQPGYFSSYGIVCGKTSTTNMLPFYQSKVKWYHGTKDTTISLKSSGAQPFIQCCKSVGIDSDIQLFDIGHNVWTKAYNDTITGNYLSWIN